MARPRARHRDAGGTSASATPLLLVGAAERFLEAHSPYTPDTTVRVTTVP